MPEELDIEIDAEGNVRVHVKGRKGKACLDYVQIFQQILGEVKDQQLTSEYYESEVQINNQMKVNTL
ncbi:MAG: DUF2997 domain-containing protein [Armatimonadetes bacterium]|nr:DUF2997 domain-containing protein [Armatimonadota bacterium]